MRVLSDQKQYLDIHGDEFGLNSRFSKLAFNFEYITISLDINIRTQALKYVYIQIVMNLSKQGTIIGFHQPKNTINDKKEHPEQSSNALSGMKKDTQNPEPNMDPVQKETEMKSNMRYFYEKIRDMQLKTKIITIFTIVSIIILTFTIIILARKTQTRVINFTFVGKQTIPNTNSSIEHYNGTIKTKDGQGKDKDINFSAQVLKPNKLSTTRLLQQDTQASASSSQQNGDIITLTFTDNDGAIAIRATSPQDFQVEFSSEIILRQLLRRFRGNINWDIKAFRLLQQSPEIIDQVNLQTQIVLKSVAQALGVSPDQLAVQQFDALKITVDSDGTYLPQMQANSRLLPQAEVNTKNNQLSDQILVQVGNMVSTEIVNRLQSVKKVLQEIIPSDFNNLDENDSLGTLLKDSNFNPEIDANVVQTTDTLSSTPQSSPAKEQKKQGTSQNNPSSEKPADSSQLKKDDDKKEQKKEQQKQQKKEQQKKPEQKKRRYRWWRSLKKRWNSRHKNRKNKKSVNASEQSFNKSTGCTDINDGKQKLCDVKVLKAQNSVFKLKTNFKNTLAVGKAKIFRRRRIINKKQKKVKDKPSNDQKSDQQLTTQDPKKETGGR